jgi:uridine phosphorylase
MLAQELLEQPKMCNHARGLWGYSGRTTAGSELTVQATGMGGPSAAIVLADLAELGVRRAVRVGTCTALDPRLRPGELLSITEAHAWGGIPGRAGEPVLPAPGLAAALRKELGTEAGAGDGSSPDTLHGGGAPAPVAAGDAADLQTATLFGSGHSLGLAVAAVLIVVEAVSGDQLGDEALELKAKRAGAAAAAILSA